MEKSLITAVQDELKKAERDSAKAKLKTMFADRIKAKETIKNIDDQIVDLLTTVGETEEGIRALLAE